MANEIDIDHLTVFWPQPERDSEIRRGPETDLTDAQLHDRRVRLTRLFENYWGEIGYKLQKCKKSEDISVLFSRLLLKPHDASIRYILTSVCRATTVVPDGA